MGKFPGTKESFTYVYSDCASILLGVKLGQVLKANIEYIVLNLQKGLTV